MKKFVKLLAVAAAVAAVCVAFAACEVNRNGIYGQMIENAEKEEEEYWEQQMYKNAGNYEMVCVYVETAAGESIETIYPQDQIGYFPASECYGLTLNIYEIELRRLSDIDGSCLMLYERGTYTYKDNIYTITFEDGMVVQAGYKDKTIRLARTENDIVYIMLFEYDN